MGLFLPKFKNGQQSMFLMSGEGSSKDKGQGGSGLCLQLFGGKVELCVVCLTVEIDVVFSEELTTREEVADEEDGTEDRALRNTRGQ